MIHMVFLLQNSDYSCKFVQASKSVEALYPGNFNILLFETNALDEDEVLLGNCKDALKKADFVFLNTHGGLAFFKSYVCLKEYMANKPVFILSGIDSENREVSGKCGIFPEHYMRMEQYFDAGGADNYKNMILYAASEILKMQVDYEHVRYPVWQGIYENGEITEDSCPEDVRSAGRLVIGILIHYHNISDGNIRHIDALIDAVRKNGGIPLAVFSNIVPRPECGGLGLQKTIEKYFMDEHKQSVIDALIVTSGFSMSVLAEPGYGGARVEKSIFEQIGVPVFQAMTTFYNYDQWKSSLMGVDQMLLSTNVYQTEYDGQIMTSTVAYTDVLETPYGTKSISLPISERIARTVRKALNWAKLRRIPMSEKRVAFILHNMPPRNDMIGSAYGLDTPESVYNMYCSLKEDGLKLDYDFRDGQQIIQKIIDGLTNDGRFTPPEKMLEKSVDTISKEVYRSWFDQFEHKVQEELVSAWGNIPGTFMTVDEKLLIPGILNGNLFIGLQPPRAFEEKAEKAYHSTDLVCPHQYLAFYRWIEKIFRADIIVHIGTHGTIEWLPGKEIGLSNQCYPDIAIDELPHLYPYIIDVPGEGVQAKRRTSACLLDYLIPSMKVSGAYGELAQLDDLIEQYYHARQGDTGKLSVLSEQIWDIVFSQNIHQDLGMTKENFDMDIEKSIERIHLWVSEIKSSEIKDGLHIFGQIPQGERYTNMLRLLVRVRNGEIPSLREGIAAASGVDEVSLLQNPEKIHGGGKTNRMWLEALDETGRQLFERLSQKNFDYMSAQEIVGEMFPKGDCGKLLECLKFVCNNLVPRLNNTTDELKNFLIGIHGGFVVPGPSGAPSRGNAGILPTGRNFYAIDPADIPSRAAWAAGKQLADKTIERYIRDEGKIPERVAIIVYAGETMKTNGDDIAEILYLYGVRPIWLNNTDRVIGLEPIPIEELKRPRIDVVLRISGLFRDTFPNLIERIEDAVNMVAALDEPPEKNYLRKHILKDIQSWTEKGMLQDQAWHMASARIFGCPPGTYGAGVDILINSKKWNTTEDLGKAYTAWSGHAYGRYLHGEKWQAAFEQQLAQCDVTIKNISSIEEDMLDSDDFYNYHGGLISAVKTQRKKMPRSYSGNSNDMNKVNIRDIHEETSRIMRARINNPDWIKGLRQHGYKGAQEVSAMVDIVFGWDATSGVIDDWMYDSIAKAYLMDENVRAWLKQANAWALHAISERLLEANQRGMWHTGQEILDTVVDVYMEMEGTIEDIE